MSRARGRVHIPASLSQVERPLPKQSMYFDGTEQMMLEMRRGRLLVLSGLFMSVFLLIGLRLVDLTVLSDDRNVRVAQAETSLAPIPMRRGLVDRNGNIIAADLRTVSLYADARDVQNPQLAAEALVGVLPHLNRESLEAKLASKRPFVWIERDLAPKQHAAVLSLGLAGLQFQADRRRVYPNGPLISQVVGYVGIDNNGLAGLEKSLDEKLLQDGDPTPVTLTLDLRVQHVLREELMKSMAEFKAKAASGMVMDVNTGEVLAMVSLPDFDPNDFQSATNNEKFNRVTLGVYEMGSTFKAFNTAMVLDAGVAGLEDRFDATKPYVTGGRTIHDFHAENKWLTVTEIFKHSSNIGSARMAHLAGVDVQTEFLSRLGLFNTPRLEVPELGRPLLPAKWGPTETATVSYGHGISVTPLQTVAAMAALVNGGYEVHPTLVREEAMPAGERKRVVQEMTSRQMRRLMREVVLDGTASRADVPGYSVAGKTGTAEKASGGGYLKKALLTSFVGVFPTEKPRYIVLAILDEPKGTPETYGYRTAGWNA
ncbi:MAG: penicillin-binding protein 2, partial [Alphaproteobacteria bacterium]